MVETNKATLKKANAAVAQGDHEGFLTFCTDDTQWTFVGDKRLQGKKAVREWMATEYFNPPKFDVKHLIGEHDFVTAVGTITIIDKEGKATHYAYCDVWRFRDGKMAELTAFVTKLKTAASQ